MVILDGIVFALQRHGGISTYFRELATRVLSRRRDAQLWRYTMDDGLIFPANRELLQRRRSLERYRGPRGIPQGAIFHSSYYRVSSAARATNIVTVYDFMYERFAPRLPRLVHCWQKARAFERADALICISNTTKNDLHHFYPRIPESRVHVVHLAASTDFFPLDGISPRVDTPAFSLFVGGRVGYKNFVAAVNAVRAVPNMRLLCVGGGAFTAEERRLLDATLMDRYAHAGSVSAAELNRYYNQAHCLIYPSLCEGFGIPLLEAMAAGCPAISTRRSSMAEIAGESAILLDDPIPSAIATGIQALFDSDTRRTFSELGRSNASRFSWDKTAQATLDIYSRFA